MDSYQAYRPDIATAGAIIIKFYHSGDQIRGYVRETSDAGERDSVFPGEELEPVRLSSRPEIMPATVRTLRKVFSGMKAGAP